MNIQTLNAQSTQRTTKCGICRQFGHNRRTCPRLRDDSLVQEPQSTPQPQPQPQPQCEDGIQEDCDNTCTICYEALNVNANFVSTPCKHLFCFKCMVQHLRNDNRCPMCRVNLVEVTPVSTPRPRPRSRRRLPQPRPRQTPQPTPPPPQGVDQYNWNNALVVRIDGIDVIPLSQALDPVAYEDVLNNLSGVSLEDAQDIIDHVFRTIRNPFIV